MKLYGVRTEDGKYVKDVGFFAAKADAKKVRDELNGGTPAALTKEDKAPKYFVTKGPDHPHYEG